MFKAFGGILFATLLIFAVCASGCQSSGGGGGYRGSDGHVGHNH